jgi:hypothetical protein
MLVGDKGTPLIAVRLGRPAEASPCRKANAVLDWTWLSSVFTTTTLATPSPWGTVIGTKTVKLSGKAEFGTSGPKFCTPAEVGTKKFTTEPDVNPLLGSRNYHLRK